MRGKKTNPEFVSEYLSTLVRRGITSSDDILQTAKDEVLEIDQRIKEVDTLKARRSKLLDVIQAFDKPPAKKEEKEVLSLFNLQYPNICKELCETALQNIPLTDGELNDEDRFCIKQLLEHKILCRFGDHLHPGERYCEYMKFVLHQG